MEGVTQRQALAETPTASGEFTRFFVSSRFGGLECLKASFQTHVYAPHTHEGFAIGAIYSGCETFSARGRQHRAGPGEFAFVNPLDVHDGAPLDRGYSYRMIYPGAETMARIAAEISGEDAGTPFFAEAVVADVELASHFKVAFDTLEAQPGSLAGEAGMFEGLALALIRHAGTRPREVGEEAGPVARVRALLDERYGEELALEDLAAVAGLSRAHLIRAFRRGVGLSPHAYLLDVRVRRAREGVRRGESPAAVAAACGFCDQSHLNRAFKARLGVTPGAFRQSALAA